MKPLAIDLFCGLGGFTDGLLAEGYDAVGFDIERHDYGTGGYPSQLVLQDVLTLHGSQFKDAALIVASPPCQEYSYMAMPWSRAKAIAAEYRSGERDVRKLTALFDSCFRIQREAIEAAGHFIPLVVENVRGAQPWVGRSRWNFGSFHLRGDVPALMPMTVRATKMRGAAHLDAYEKTGKGLSDWTMKAGAACACGHSWMAHDRQYGCSECDCERFQRGGDGTKVGGLDWNGYKNGDPDYKGQAFNTHAERIHKVPGFRFDGSGRSFQSASVEGQKTHDLINIRNGHSHTRHLTNQAEHLKGGGDWFASGDDCSLQRKASSGSNARKAASAAIAKIPMPLARHIGRVYRGQG